MPHADRLIALFLLALALVIYLSTPPHRAPEPKMIATECRASSVEPPVPCYTSRSDPGHTHPIHADPVPPKPARGLGYPFR